MKGAQVSVKFPSRDSTWKDFMFNGQFPDNAKRSGPAVQSQTELDAQGSLPRQDLFAEDLLLDKDIILEYKDIDLEDSRIF
jgi:hypothetical protein